MPAPDAANSTPAPVTDAAWYIVRQAAGDCEIVPASELDATPEPNADASATAEAKTWGPFASEGEAIARRVGLIRAGHCQPR